MKKLLAATAAVVFTASAIGLTLQAQGAAVGGEPLWAWGFNTPPAASPPPPAAPAAAPAAAPDPKQHSIPGSKFTFTRAQISNRYAPADWFPEDHPPMPDIVAHGRESANPPINACGLCHMPNGKGRPENAWVSGLPYDYIMQQLTDFKNGHRKTSDNRKTNTALMEGFAQQMTREEMETAAKYFSSIPATPWIKVVESDTAPKTRLAGGVFLPLDGKDAGTEPLGNRIVEAPPTADDFELLRNPHSGFTAYVPKGSLKKGEDIVRTGAGKVTACVVCHGQDLRGLGPVPPIAGRSPSYLARQLYDIQQGNRAGAWSPLMVPIVTNLSTDDMLAVSAYVASLKP